MSIPHPQGGTLQGIPQPLFQFQPYCEGYLLVTAEKIGQHIARLHNLLYTAKQSN